MSELNKQIENRELAHTMALAEVSHRAIAKVALEHGETESHEAALKTAEKLGLQAGKTYLKELLIDLETQEQEFLHDVGVVRTTEDEMFSFYSGQIRYTRNTRTRAWNALKNGQKVYENHGLENILVTETTNYGGQYRRFNTSSGQHERFNVIAINLDERVMDILPEVEECGKLSQAFIKDFYASKLAEKTAQISE